MEQGFKYYMPYQEEQMNNNPIMIAILSIIVSTATSGLLWTLTWHIQKCRKSRNPETGDHFYVVVKKRKNKKGFFLSLEPVTKGQKFTLRVGEGEYHAHNKGEVLLIQEDKDMNGRMERRIVYISPTK